MFLLRVLCSKDEFSFQTALIEEEDEVGEPVQGGSDSSE